MATIAGYTTTYNCIERQYPFEECLHSLLGFCDEVSVVDGGSTDGTIESVRRLARREPRIKLSVEPVDFSHPRWAIEMDGKLKAKSRAQCTANFCWQTDTDEIVAESDWAKVRALPDMLKEILDLSPVIFLPMVEFWGSFSRIRADFFSWKPRFSRNDSRITHGIPKEFVAYDEAGREYPRPFDSDSCNYMWRDTKESVPMVVPVRTEGFYPGSPDYERLFNASLDLLPSVLHVSWLHLERKIRHYREFWPKFHASMYNLAKPDAPEHNVMFNKRWAEVTDEEIREKARQLDELGPRSFHYKLDPTKKGTTIPFHRAIPEPLRSWAERVGS